MKNCVMFNNLLMLKLKKNWKWKLLESVSSFSTFSSQLHYLFFSLYIVHEN